MIIYCVPVSRAMSTVTKVESTGSSGMHNFGWFFFSSLFMAPANELILFLFNLGQKSRLTVCGRSFDVYGW